MQGHQLPQGARVLLGQPFPFHQQPVAVAARQQLATIEDRRLPQMLGARDGIGCPIGPRQLLLKGDHVHLATGIIPPLHRQVIDHQKTAGLWNRLAQAVPEMAAVGERLLLGGIGPKEKGDRPARNRPATAQHQVDQQLLQARLIHPGNGLPSPRHLKTAQQLDGQERLIIHSRGVYASL